MTDHRVATPTAVPNVGARPVIEATLGELVARARRLIASGQRRVLGVTGSPGAGKSTLCAALLAELGSDAVLVQMDGFHLASTELARLGRANRKGACDTFDVDGYIALLRRLRHQTAGVIYAPVFNRRIEESIGSAVPVSAETPPVVTEGNYLLLHQAGWSGVRDWLDEVWFLDVDPQVRQQRLVRRRRSFGHSVIDARDWVTRVDESNAARIDGTRDRADLLVQLRTKVSTAPGSDTTRAAGSVVAPRTAVPAPIAPDSTPSSQPNLKEH